MKHNKLIRDKIPSIIEKDGKKAVTRILDEEEFKIYLEKKLDEEVKEFHESKSLEEIADILEALHALCNAYGYSVEDLYIACELKRNERGAFTKRILLEEIKEKET